MTTPFSRRDFLRVGSGAAFAAFCAPQILAQGSGSSAPLVRATIPSTGYTIARIGLGTWQTFDVGGDTSARAQLAEVLSEFSSAGAQMIDTSPMYGTSERVLGDLMAELRLREKLVVATKVWTTGRAAGVAQMEESLRLLRTDRVELMQIHNLVDWRTHLTTLWQQAGRTRLIGVTHYSAGSLGELTRVVRSENIDFVQYALSLDEFEAAEDFLKLCADRGVAFIANRPFGGGGALRRTRGKPLPEFAAEWDIRSWAQYLLKWVLSHPEVTCAIPGTSRPQHMRDNLDAARGRMPDAAAREKMTAAWRML